MKRSAKFFELSKCLLLIGIISCRYYYEVPPIFVIIGIIFALIGLFITDKTNSTPTDKKSGDGYDNKGENENN